MQPSAALAKQSAHLVGGPISAKTFTLLTESYRSVHPSEQASVFIPRSAILETLCQLPGISGIRFMYGIDQDADLSSRTIVLVPCSDAQTDRAIPNVLFLKTGYFNDRGERLRSDECWMLFTRYVDRMQQLLRGVDRNSIPRAYFMGRNVLEQMLTHEAAGIVFHFGYHREEPVLAQRYTAALVAVEHQLTAIGTAFDTGIPCPPNGGCPPPPPPGFDMPFFMRELPPINDAAFTELCHYAVPALVDAFRQSGIGEIESRDHLEHQFAACTDLARAGKHNEANALYKTRLEELIAQHLLVN